MADPRGGLGNIARNGNSAARTYGAGIRPLSREPSPGRPARARSGAWSVTGGRSAVAGSASAATASRSAAAAGVGGESAATGTDEGAAGGEAADGDSDDDSDPDAPNLGGGVPEPGGAPGARGVPEPGGGCAVRRAVLLGLVASGAALVAGCGGDDPPSRAGQADQASAPPSVSPTPEPSLEPFPGADDGQGDSDGQGTGLVKTGEVPVGGAVLAGDYLIAQPQRGVFKAFDATCPHQGITVDPPIGTNDYFVCPGHNSKFRLADGGRISGPAPRGLKPVAVKVSNGYVVEA
jgi:nitrite reductase/ring-hydroxylating ferredoxin subunit